MHKIIHRLIIRLCLKSTFTFSPFPLFHPTNNFTTSSYKWVPEAETWFLIDIQPALLFLIITVNNSSIIKKAKSVCLLSITAHITERRDMTESIFFVSERKIIRASHLIITNATVSSSCQAQVITILHLSLDATTLAFHTRRVNVRERGNSNRKR